MVSTSLRSRFSVLDHLTVAFFAYLYLRLLFSPTPADELRLQLGALLLSFTVCVYGLRRAGFMAKPRWSLCYRLLLFGVHVYCFVFLFRDLLMAFELRLLDIELQQLDRWLFNGSPALWLERFNSSWLTEYLSFFYLLHFGVFLAAVGPVLVMGRAGRLGLSLLIGSLVLLVIGWVTYTLVPAMGPYQALIFERPLDGGVLHGSVQAMIAEAGPLVDVFPSLHAGYTYFVGLQVSRYATSRRLRRLARAIQFVEWHMIMATIYLRYHYVVDVIAGLCLAHLVDLATKGYMNTQSEARLERLNRQLFGTPLKR